jgi:hypothetical protein
MLTAYDDERERLSFVARRREATVGGFARLRGRGAA